MATITQDVNEIRTAVFGKLVREAIADAIEQCYYLNGHLIVNGINVIEDTTGLIIISGGTGDAP